MIIEKLSGSGEYSNRAAEIHEHEFEKYYYVKLYTDGLHTDTRILRDKSLRYAEDTAENWITGVIHG